MRSAFLLFVSAALASAARLPVAFEANRGQEPGSADFVVHTSSAAVALSSGRVQWVSRNSQVELILESARRGVRGQGEQQLPGVVNYLVGNEPSRWLKDIPTYSRVRYSQVYPGIDAVYYINDGRLEYDFVLGAGADPARLRLRVRGARSMRIDDAGDLLIAGADGDLRQHLPAIYQEVNGERHAIVGRYRLRGSEVRFELGSYDSRRPLVIDPVLTWATYLFPGSSSSAQVSAMALDSSGNTYLAGQALTTTGYYYCVIAKLNSSGTSFLTETLIGGAGGDSVASAIAVDSSGNIYLAGATDSPYFLSTDPYYQLTYYPGYSLDGFVMKVDNLVQTPYFSYYFGGSSSDMFNGIALDSSNNIYLVGSTNSPDLPVGGSSARTNFGGAVDAFVVEFSSSGSPIYSTYLGGSGSDYGNAIAADAAGDAYVTGSTTSANFPTAGGPYQAALKAGADAFVAKIAPNTGGIVYSTFLGGSGDEEGNGIAVDASGAAYVTGDTSSTNFPLMGPYQSTYGGGATDAFITRLAGSGQSLLYSTYLGGSGADAGFAIVTDPAGNSYVTGSTTSTDYPVTGDAFQASNQAASGATNAIVTGLNASGAGLLFSSYLGGNTSQSASAGDFGTAVALNCAAGLVVAGGTSSNNFPATSAAATAAYPGGTTDGFVAKIAAGGGVPTITPGGIVNNATFASGPVAPGSIVSVFGGGLAPFTQSFSGFPLSNSLGGATVTVNGVNAPMFYASSGQVNVQIPFEVTPGPSAMTIANACGSSGQVSFQVAQAAPYILQTGSGQAILLNQDNTVNGPGNPARVGSYIQIFLIGIGATKNQPADGAANPGSPLPVSTLNYSATLGSSSASVAYLGLAPGWVGLDQLNISVPPTLSTGSYPVTVTVAGVQSNGPMVYVTQ